MSTMEGLPVRSIHIEYARDRELRMEARSRRFVPVKLVIDGRSSNAQLGIRGGHTRNYPKKSYELRLPDGEILHWNAEMDDPSMMRNALSFQFFTMIGVPAPRTKHFWLEWNGEPQGVYLEIESVNRNFFKRRKISYKSLIYGTNDNANFSLIDPETKRRKASLIDGYEWIRGGDISKKRLGRFVGRINRLKGNMLRQCLIRNLDIRQYLHWLAGAVLTGNYDGFDQNYALYEHPPTGRYRIIPWDYEGTWGRNCYGRPCGSDLVPIQGYNKLTEKVLAFSSCRQAYRKILVKLLRKPFTVEDLGPVIDRMHNHIAAAIYHDHTRKHDYRTFMREKEFIRQYIHERRQVVKRELAGWKD
jgi:Spore coat assembly protein